MSTYEGHVNPIVSGVLTHCNIVCSSNAHEGFYRNWTEAENPHCLVALERDIIRPHTPDQDEHRIYIRVKLQVLGTGNSNTDARSVRNLVGLIEDRLHADNQLSGACCWITTEEISFPPVVEEGLAWWGSEIVLQAYKTW